MNENPIKEENYSDYKKRVEELQGMIVSAYFDYYYLINISERQKEYKGTSLGNFSMKQPTMFFNKIISVIQKELLLIVWNLEDNNSNANSLNNLKAKLSNYLCDFNNYKNTLLKMPSPAFSSVNNIRNKYIAHVDLKRKIQQVDLCEVKQRLDILKSCYNSYLFGDLKNCSVSAELIEKIKNDCKNGVIELLNGDMDKMYLLYKTDKNNN